jgi:hypothetical protein
MPSIDAWSEVAPGTKFAAIVLRARHVALPAGGVRVGEGVAVLPKVPFPVEDFWVEWTGKVGTRVLTEGNCVILASMPSDAPTTEDEEFPPLRTRVSYMLAAMHLEGTIAVREAAMASGGRDAEGVSVRQVAQLADHVGPAYVRAATVDEALCVSAWLTCEGIARIYASPDHARVKRGFHALRGGFGGRSGAERLHQFVRSVDALLKSPQGGGRRHFGSRGTLLAGPGSEELLRELFDLRGQAEHLNDLAVMTPHPRIRDAERLALYRSYQAQLLACTAYRRIFSSASLLEHFRDDAAIDAFWMMPSGNRQELWGAPIDLEQAAANHFRGWG